MYCFKSFLKEISSIKLYNLLPLIFFALFLIKRNYLVAFPLLELVNNCSPRIQNSSKQCAGSMSKSGLLSSIVLHPSSSKMRMRTVWPEHHGPKTPPQGPKTPTQNTTQKPKKNHHFLGKKHHIFFKNLSKMTLPQIFIAFLCIKFWKIFNVKLKFSKNF